MCLEKILRLRGTLAFRLTLWYAGIFTISTFVAFLAFYLLISSVIQERRDQDLLDDVKEFTTILATQGIGEVKAEMDREASSDGAENIFLRLFSTDGRELASTEMSSWREVDPGSLASKKLKNGGDYVLETLTIPEHEHQVRTVYGIIGPETILQIGESLEEDAEFLEILREIFVPVMVVMTILATLVGWFMARRALAGVEEVTQTALQISEGDLDKRVTVKAGGNEIKRLADTFNYMLDRISELIKETRELSDNIAHDLRTPLARIRGAAEMALTTAATIDEHKSMAAGMIEECDRLLEKINTMLDIVEAESGAAELILEEVDISGLVRDACEIFQAIAEDNSVTINTELAKDCAVSGEVRKLQRMVANLLDNALKFTPPAGTITVSVNADNERVVISVSDTGVGIPEADLPHIFKRFYRCDQSRTQQGNGLGLSFVKAIVRSHGGNVSATSRPGEGSTFTVTLPR